VADDGLLFLTESVRAEEIRAAGEQGGVRVRLEARLAAARINLQVDIGFGDLTVPDPEEVEFPVLLDGPAPRIRVYSRESVIAEKLHATVLFGDANTRMKDFYDLFTLSRLFPFDGSTLIRAIATTFERRGMPLPLSLPIRATFFEADSRATQWRAYLERTRLDTAPGNFATLGEALRDFLGQPYDALMARCEFPESWTPGGPWR
jgi:hypothetical protein